ncbi:MAG: hypothetical protein CME61_06640 [Halobacteriovoraceae bacterium]|nr:hypothetical protein [Halobacteriovoraceae bacterium]
MLNKIVLLLASLVLSSCNLIFSVNVDWSTRESLEQSYRSKFQTFYKGERLPPKILESEFEGYKKALESKDISAEVKEKLEKRFRGDYALMSYEYIDMDDDGIGDWDWNENLGLYVANDQDLDDDGISNFLDQDPYDPKVLNNDKDFDGIPDHLDWDMDGDGLPEDNSISKELVGLQLDIFKKFKIFAINQEAFHDYNTLKASIDVLTLAFFNIINEHDSFPGVNFLGANKGHEDSSTLAFYRSWQDLISIQELGRIDGKNPLFSSIIPLNFYATLIHEFGHALEKRLQQNYGENFLEDFLLKDLFVESSGSYTYKGKSKGEWHKEGITQIKNTLNVNNNELGRETFNRLVDKKKKVYVVTQSDVYKSNLIPSTYALSSPGEYYAEALCSYVFQVMSKTRFKGHKEEKKLKKKLDIAIEKESGIGIYNISLELFKFFDNVLFLDGNLYFDRESRISERLKGKWVIKN